MFDVREELRVVDDDQFGFHCLGEFPPAFGSRQARVAAPDDCHGDIEGRERAVEVDVGVEKPAHERGWRETCPRLVGRPPSIIDELVGEYRVVDHTVVAFEVSQGGFAGQQAEQHLADQRRTEQRAQPHPAFGHRLGGGTDEHEFGELGLLCGHHGVGSRQRGGHTDRALGELAGEIGDERRVQRPRVDERRSGRPAESRQVRREYVIRLAESLEDGLELAA